MKCKLSIQEKLKDLRIEKGLSLQELSEQTGISRASLENYETDDYKEISHKAIITLADFYGVTSDYLLGLTENREQHLFPVDELGLDMEIYVDNLAGMQFRNINKMIEQTRVRLQNKGIPLTFSSLLHTAFHSLYTYVFTLNLSDCRQYRNHSH